MTVTLGNRSAIPAPRRGSGVFERARTVTEPALRAAVDSLPPTTRRAVGYHFGWWDGKGNDRLGTPGKAVRPALVLVAAGAVGGTPVGMAAVSAVPAAIPAAVAVEWVHTFSLLHDDVLDGDGLRRHWPTVAKAFGTGAALLAGDALLALAFDVLAATAHPAGALETDGWRDWCGTESKRHLRAALDQLGPGITVDRQHDLRAIARLVADRDR